MTKGNLDSSAWVLPGLREYKREVFICNARMLTYVKEICALYKVDPVFIMDIKSKVISQDTPIRHLIIFLLFISTNVTYDEMADIFGYTSRAGSYHAVHRGAELYRLARVLAKPIKKYVIANEISVCEEKRKSKLGKVFITETNKP